MNRRLVGCGCAALLLHVAFASFGAMRPSAKVLATRADAETDIDLVALPAAPEALPPEEEPPLPPPESRPPPSAPSAPAAVAARTRARPAPSALAGIITSPDAEPSAGAVPVPPPDAEPAPNPPTPPARRLSLADLGLTGTSAAIQPPLPDAPSRATSPDVAGMKAALAARDVALGLGPGGAVADQLRRLAHDIAPLGSEATISVDLAKDGSLDTLWLEDVTSNEQDWRKVLHSVRLRLGKRFIASGGPVRVTLLVTSRSAKRSGNSSSFLDFDVSNIGSPTLHTLHVRVLGQAPL
jgi:hypothetical protein